MVTLARRLPPLLVAAALLASLAAVPARAALSSTTSTNWAGYAASRPGVRFERVSASWTLPALDCSGGAGFSSTWVGLGGFERSSRGLEQTGVDADCRADGRTVYSAWYELLPAGAVTLPASLHAGDRVRAAVTVNGRGVRLSVHDLTSGSGFTRVKRMSSPDLSSAEWIVEAPAACSHRGCRDLPLANFGQIGFSRASATSAGGRTGTISSPLWSATAITLGQKLQDAGHPASPPAGAAPSPLAAAGSSFTVGYLQQAPVAGGQPVTLPGGGS